jgi:hypothetical protein
MRRERLEVRSTGSAAPLVRPAKPELRDREALLVARLASVERAYDELAVRLRRYEGERVAIKERLGRLLAALGAGGSV